MGYFWPEDGWDEKVLTDAGLPISLLPQVFGDVYLVFGNLCCVFCIWHGAFCILVLCIWYLACCSCVLVL